MSTAAVYFLAPPSLPPSNESSPDMNRYFGLHTLEGEWHALLPRYLLLSDSIQGARVLDIGCGSGLGASLLLELGASAVDAIDHRPAVLELARMKHAKEGLDFHVMLWEELDFPEDTFDVILCLDPSSPVTDPNLLREVRRVLRSGGRYICAIERKNVKGVEALLPRYGYADAAERVDINAGSSRVPQIGEISRHFPRLHTIVQRPHISYVFDYAPSAAQGGADNAGAEQRRSGEEEVLHLQESETQEQPERWVHVDKSFCINESEVASVELWFCGDDNLQVPKLREVKLPYYSLVSRLSQMYTDMQARQRAGLSPQGQAFDELLEAGSEQTETYDIEDTKKTSEIALDAFDHQVTQIRAKPLPPSTPTSPPTEIRPTLQLGQLDAHLAELDALHRRIKTDFDRMFFETRAIFDEREANLRDAIGLLATPYPQNTNDRSQEEQAMRARISELELELATLRADLGSVSGNDDEDHPRLERRSTNEFVRPEGFFDPPSDEEMASVTAHVTSSPPDGEEEESDTASAAEVDGDVSGETSEPAEHTSSGPPTAHEDGDGDADSQPESTDEPVEDQDQDT